MNDRMQPFETRGVAARRCARCAASLEHHPASHKLCRGCWGDLAEGAEREPCDCSEEWKAGYAEGSGLTLSTLPDAELLALAREALSRIRGRG